ncbi:hypothetical protein ACLBWT_23335 [Paenibacillus sp. D51F]
MINDWNYYAAPTMEWGQESERDRKEWSHESESHRKAWSNETKSDRKASGHEYESNRKASDHEYESNRMTSDHEYESNRKTSDHPAAVPAANAHLLAQIGEQLKSFDKKWPHKDGDSPDRHYAVVNSGLYDSVMPNREKASPALYVIRGGKSL